MTDPCDNLEEFVDGELSPDEAERFRDHLAACAVCQRELHGLMVLDVLGDEWKRERDRADRHDTTDPSAPGEAPAGPGASPPASEPPKATGQPSISSLCDVLERARRRRQRTLALATASVMAAAAACLVLFRGAPEPGRDPHPGPIAHLLDIRPPGPGVIEHRFPDHRFPGHRSPEHRFPETRSMEARLAHPSVDDHRPYNPTRAAGQIPDSDGTAERLLLARIATFNRVGDHHGLAIAWLLDGRFDRARSALAKTEDSVDVRSDQAAILVTEHRAHEALDVLRDVLAESPEHGPALWNRALALRELGLSLGAASAFERVAQLGEAGWADEARERAASLRRKTSARREATTRALQSTRGMVLSGQPVAERVARAHPGYTRLYFYEALRAAPSADVVRRFRPLAELLDDHHGGEILRRHVERVASADFRHRAPLADAYRARYHARPPRSASRYDALLSDLLDSIASDSAAAADGPAHADDILLGALLHERRAIADPDLYAALATRSGDPWFLTLAAQIRGQHHIERSEVFAAETALRDARRICRQERLPYRCVRVEQLLAETYSHLRRMPQAFDITRSGLERARRLALWNAETRFIQILTQAHRYRGEVGAAEAHAHEVLLRAPEEQPWRCRARRFAHIELAGIYSHLLESERVREHIAALQECASTTPSPLEAVILAHLTRQDPRPHDNAALARYLVLLRAEESSPGNRALADQIEGVALIHRAETRALGTQRLRRAIEAAAHLPTHDPDRSVARSLSYAELVMDAGHDGAFTEVLALLAEEIDATPPTACALGMAISYERELTVAIDPSGQVLGHYHAERRSPVIEIGDLVPEALKRALADCPMIDVFARPPLIGRAGFLPVEQAWRYRVGPARSGPTAAAPAPSRGPGIRLVVADVEPPDALRLPRLAGWRDRGRTPGEEVTALLGPMATPTAVRGAMIRASIIEIHSHGMVESGVSDAATLVLTPDGGGADASWALTEREIRDTRLRGDPLVLLGACHGAASAPYNYKTWSLPVAFLDAGARAVIASPAPMPDASVEAFFAAVRARVQNGEPPAIALRNERVSQGAEPWQREVIVFE